LCKGIEADFLADRWRIIGVADTDWFGPWMSRQQILARLARRHAVSFSRGPLSVSDRFSREWFTAPVLGEFVESQGVHVDRRSSLLLRWPRFPSFDQWVIERAAKRMLNALPIRAGEKRIAYLFHPRMIEYVDALQADRVVYHAYDDFSLYPDWSDDDAEAQQLLVSQADLVLASSPINCKKLERHARSPVHLLKSGVDYDAFACEGARESVGPVGATGHTPEVPEDLASIPRPRLAYCGNLSAKVDLELIASLAEARRDWNFVLIGALTQADVIHSEGLRRCRSAPNVHLLGHKRYSEIPDYCHAMDVNLVTYKIGAGLWSEACSPLKLYEYLAVGHPVVSCDLPAVREHADVLAIAADKEEWIAAIEAALDEGGVGDPEKRRAVAKSQTWDLRVDQIESLIAKTFDRERSR